jgi:hypothetical protein
MSNQEDPMRTTVKPVHEWTTPDSENTPVPKIGGTLGSIVVLLGVLFAAATMVSFNSAKYQVICVLTVAVVASVVAAVVVIVALRHMPITRPFLKKFVALLLLTTLVLGGFYECAVLAREGSLWRMLGDVFEEETHGSVTVPPVLAALSLPISGVFDFSGDHISELSRFVPSIAILLCEPYEAMFAPYFVLILLITPASLALPVFWLWVILSVMYVVLPQRAWKWAGNALWRGCSVVWRRKSA